MWRKLIPVQVEKRFLYRCKISLRNTYQAPNYWKEHHKVEETMKGQATVHSTLLAVHVCVRMHVRVCVCVWGGQARCFGGERTTVNQIYVQCNGKKQECSICTSNNYFFINKKKPKNDNNITTTVKYNALQWMYTCHSAMVQHIQCPALVIRSLTYCGLSVTRAIKVFLVFDNSFSSIHPF